jgi:hypothetical protein
MTYELPTAPLSIGGVLDSAIRLYRDSIRRSWILALLYSVILGIFGFFWSLAVNEAVVPGSKPSFQTLAAIFSPAAIAGFAVATLVSMTFYGALMKTLSLWAKGDESHSLGGVIAVGVRRLPAVVLGAVVFVLAMMIGLILLVVPGIYIFGKFQLWMPAIFVDDASAMDAIGISWRLTRGRWWRGTAILTVALIMLYVFSLPQALVSGIITVSHWNPVESAIVTQLIAVVSSTIVVPMFAAILIVMYHDFKLRSEGGDLATRMGALRKA